MIYNIVIMPLETIFSWIFHAVYNLLPQTGIIGCIIGVSLAMNLLALPLYNIADKIQENERRVAKSLEYWTKHIKRTFKGDERFMMLSEYYRQNNYHPIYALRSTLSILIQVPFFIAAYHYLRGSELLKEAGFYIFKDLGAPDGLIPISFGTLSFTINVLPILMTAINCISGALYSKDAPLREKAQIYLLAAVFLVLLYKSPSGLVIYWILNNIFSLVKNIMKRIEHKGRFLYAVLCFALLIFVHFISRNRFGYKKKTLLCATYALIALPFLLNKFHGTHLCKFAVDFKKETARKLRAFFDHFGKQQHEKTDEKENLVLLLLSGSGLAVLCGLLLPSNVIASSPVEFSFLGNTPSPLSYVASSFCVFFGFFVFWPLAIFKMFGRKVRTVLPVLLFAVFVGAVLNAYVFSADYGNVDTAFNLADVNAVLPQNKLYVIVPLEIFVGVFFLYRFIRKHDKASLLSILVSAVCVGMLCVSLINIKKINTSYKDYALNFDTTATTDTSIQAVYHLSKSGKNVIVLFLDGAMGPFVGQIFAEFPEIKQKFDGFTWFPNTLSFSGFTLEGSPPIYGGYEYNQEGMNSRKEEFLRDKNTEAQLVSAKLFSDAGWESMITDPPFPDYKNGDLSCYKIVPEVTVKNIEGKYYRNFIEEKGLWDNDDADVTCRREVVNFVFLQILYPKLRKSFYLRIRGSVLPKNAVSSVARDWFHNFSHLYFLPELTDFSSEKNSFINIHSLATHEVRATPNADLESVNNELSNKINAENSGFNSIAINHYRVDAAALKQLGKFFDYLRENDCYDNTRIIVVSDHGFNMSGKNPKTKQEMYLRRFLALLLVKDFNSCGEVVENAEFMTNADTLFIAKKDLDLANVNPFTGRVLEQYKENGITVYNPANWIPTNYLKSTQFDLNKSKAWHVLPGDIYDESNWIPLLEWEERQKNGGSK